LRVRDKHPDLAEGMLERRQKIGDILLVKLGHLITFSIA
jgi:hypothetical protein